MRMTMNVLLSLIIQAKHTNGHNGNGRLLVRLLHTIADVKDERELRELFYDTAHKGEAFHKIDRLILRFLPKGKGYPYDKITFSNFENSFGDTLRFKVHLDSMSRFCDDVLDAEKIEPLVFTLLDILRNDDTVDTLCYGGNVIAKSELFGTITAPKQVCVEALLVGLLYHVHKYHPEENTNELRLIKRQNPMGFSLVRWNGNSDVLNTDIEISHNYISRIIAENSLSIVGTVHEYIGNFKSRTQLESFIINYAMPMYARRMYGMGEFDDSDTISRSDIYSQIEQAFVLFVHDDIIFQNFLAPVGFDRGTLLCEWQCKDIIEVIINTGFMKVDAAESHKIAFVNDVFKKYFAVRCTWILVSAFVRGYAESDADSQKLEYLQMCLDRDWFNHDNSERYAMLRKLLLIENAENLLDDLLKINIGFCYGDDRFLVNENIDKVKNQPVMG